MDFFLNFSKTGTKNIKKLIINACHWMRKMIQISSICVTKTKNFLNCIFQTMHVRTCLLRIFYGRFLRWRDCSADPPEESSFI